MPSAYRKWARCDPHIQHIEAAAASNYRPHPDNTTCARNSALARMELKVTARELIKRLDNFKLEIPAEEVKFMPTGRRARSRRCPYRLREDRAKRRRG